METQKLTAFINDSSELAINLEWAGAAFEPADEWALIFTAKDSDADLDSNSVFQKASGAGITVSGSVATVELVPTDTESLSDGKRLFDVQAQNILTQKVRTVAFGELYIMRDITRLTETSVPVSTSEEPLPFARTAAEIHAATTKATPIDADEFGFWDSVGDLLRKATWANIKATLKAYFDTLYQAAGNYAAAVHTHPAADISNSTAAGRALITAADGAAQRTAMETISRAEYEALMRSMLDPAAVAYQATTGIDLAAAADVSAFLKGLDSLGLRSSLVDAGLYQSRFQKSSGATWYSLLGNANLTATGSPARHRNGVLFDNSDPTSPASPERLYGNITALTGQWTILTVALRDRESPASSGQRHAFKAFRTAGEGGLSMAVQMQNSSNWQSYTYSGGSAALGINGPQQPAEHRWKLNAMRNVDPSASDSFSSDVLNDSAAKQSTTGRGNVPFQHIAVGAGSNDGSAFSNYYDGIVPMWVVFNSVLTDSQLSSVEKLVNTTIARRVKWVLEGDSISTSANGWAWGLRTASEWLGRNLDLKEVGLGGETSVGAVARIGKQGCQLYLTGQPVANETVTLAGQAYTWKASVASAYDVKIGTSVLDSLNNFKAAVNGASGAGTLYGTGTTANAVFTAVSSGNSAVLYLLFDSSAAAVSVSESMTYGFLYGQDQTTAITTTEPMGICRELVDPTHPTWCLIQCGSNDPGDTATPAETVANLQLLWAAARSAGMKVVACTIPRSTNAGYWTGGSGLTVQDGYIAANALVRAATADYDALLDVDAILADDDPTEYWNNSAILSDGVHPSNASRRAVMNDLWQLIGEHMP